jgi:Flp pilus assembly protein TadD
MSARLKGSRSGTPVSRDEASGARRLSAERPGARRLSAERVWWRLAIVVLAGVLAYSNSLAGPFIFDDTASVVENASIRDWRPSTALVPQREVPTAGRPIVNVSLAINYALGGLDVRGYHVWNIAVHLLCGVLVFACVRRTLAWPPVPDWWRQRALDVAFAVALVWTLHPLNTEVVDYVTERTESMMAAFYLLTIYASARAIDSRRRQIWQAAASVSCALGMACKESMVTAPLVVVLYDAVFVFGSLKLAIRDRWRYYGLLAATWLVLAALLRSGPRVHSAGFSVGVTPWTYLLNQTVMIARYLRLAVWPTSLVLHYGSPRVLTVADVLPYALLLVSLAGLTLVALRRRPALGFLGAWFFVTLAPTSSILPIATEVGAERRMYLPLVALVVLGVLGVIRATARFTRSRAIGLAALVAVTVTLAAGTLARNREYVSALDMALTVLERWPGPVAEAMLGQQLAIAGRHDEAMAHLRAAAPGYPKAHYHLGGELFNAGRLDEATVELQTFVREAPLLVEAVPARTMLGRTFMMQKQWPRAEEQLRMVLSMTSPQGEAHTTAFGLLADTLFGEERFDEAAAQYRTYLSLRPTDGGAMTNLGISLAATGKDDEAIAAFRRAVELNPRDARARRNLEVALESMRERR